MAAVQAGTLPPLLKPPIPQACLERLGCRPGLRVAPALGATAPARSSVVPLSGCRHVGRAGQGGKGQGSKTRDNGCHVCKEGGHQRIGPNEGRLDSCVVRG